MSDLTIPDEADDWPFEARRFVLAEANTTLDLRREIDGIVGLEPIDVESSTEAGKSAAQFTKAQLAAILLALGGGREGSA